MSLLEQATSRLFYRLTHANHSGSNVISFVVDTIHHLRALHIAIRIDVAASFNVDIVGERGYFKVTMPSTDKFRTRSAYCIVNNIHLGIQKPHSDTATLFCSPYTKQFCFCMNNVAHELLI